MEAESILRLPAVRAATGLSRSTIYARIAAGTFPKPIPLGTHAVGWIASEINAWIQQLITEGRKAA
jgi:prophage regulatory protein